MRVECEITNTGAFDAKSEKYHMASLLIGEVEHNDLNLALMHLDSKMSLKMLQMKMLEPFHSRYYTDGGCAPLLLVLRLNGRDKL